MVFDHALSTQVLHCTGDHDFIVAEIKRAVLPIKEIHAVSEVQVYYKDNGLISTKVDILLPPNLTIHQAHAIAG
jgi:divalent metal cation (Fe/Co/Zn/Cd) transporter